MPKTGRKYTKQQPAKGSTNMLKKSNASSRPNRTAPKKGDSNMRSSDTIKRLKMYNNGKAIRNKEGTIVGGQFMMRDRAGDTEITAATGRIQPDRRWFGNTRVVGQTELDKFRDEMTSKVADPYSVVLKRKKLPMGLLQDAAIMHQEGNAGSGLLTNEPFHHAFGGKSRRKKVKLEQLMVGRKSAYDEQVDHDGKKSTDNLNFKPIAGGQAVPVEQMPDSDAAGYAALFKAAQVSKDTYDTVNNRQGIVPWGKDSNITRTEGEGVDWRAERKADLFLKGQSKRIWGEFYKVVDCSDVILHIIDARNVPGTRCTMIEKHIAKNASHKHLVFVLNKIDLVPNWVAKRWIGELSAVRPTIAFHASMTHAFGKGALISLLRQFGKLHADKKQISVGVIGYPNVGKSSVINTLISKKSCKVAPIPGETKIWQYITLFRNIYLIDCPGVVVDTAGDTEEDSVLKGVVRAERLENPEDFIIPILKVVKREHIAAQYGLPKDGDGTWKDHIDLLEKIARKAGRLLKGGDPCLRSAAIYMIIDYQRGRLPHFVPPPELKEDAEAETAAPSVSTATLPGIKGVKQNLEEIVQRKEISDEKANHEDSEDEISDNEEGDNDSGGLIVTSGDWEDNK
jgi:nuclear GTP-binding protein